MLYTQLKRWVFLCSKIKRNFIVKIISFYFLLNTLLLGIKLIILV